MQQLNLAARMVHCSGALSCRKTIIIGDMFESFAENVSYTCKDQIQQMHNQSNNKRLAFLPELSSGATNRSFCERNVV